MTLSEEIRKLEMEFVDYPEELELRIKQARFIHAQTADQQQFHRNIFEQGNVCRQYYAQQVIVTEHAIDRYLAHLRNTGQAGFAAALLEGGKEHIKTAVPFIVWNQEQNGVSLEDYLEQNLSPEALKQHRQASNRLNE